MQEAGCTAPDALSGRDGTTTDPVAGAPVDRVAVPRQRTGPTGGPVMPTADLEHRAQRALLDQLPAMIGYWDRDLRNVFANRAYVDWLGQTPDRIRGRHVSEVLGPDLYARNRSRLEAALAGEHQEFEREITDPRGRNRHSQTAYLPDVDGSTVLGVMVLVTDVTERVAERSALGAAVAAERETKERLHEASTFQQAVLAASPDMVDVTDLEHGRSVWASRSLEHALGHPPDHLRGLDPRARAALVHPEDLPALEAADAGVRRLADGEVVQVRYRIRHADGTYRWLSRRVTPFTRDGTGAVTHSLAVSRDITDTVEVEERLATAATHDALTGLPNRTLLADRLRHALQRQARGGREVAVLFCDLDGFKRVNDTGGHQAGDAVLVAVAQRLRTVLRPADTVARVGGDEFVLLLEPDAPTQPDGSATGSPATDFRSGSVAVADRVCAALGEPVPVGRERYHVSVSIGITFAGAGADPEAVLRDADTAMYRAKRRGKARAELFDGALRADAVERAHVEATLRAALHGPGDGHRRPTLSVAYQPVFDLAARAMVGVEALARLHDEHGVPLSPGDFIPVAEDTGMIAELGHRVLETACADLAAWHGADPAWRDLTLGVNLSARQAGLAGLVDEVTGVLQRTGLAAEQLTLELTESVLLDAGRSTLSALHTLRDLGVRIAIDDFGTGYASLRYLAQLPVTSVKVDRSFVVGLPHDRVSRSIVRAIAGLARDLGIGCVVEGIETDEQLTALPAGVLGQGFLLGRPLAEPALRRLLAGGGRYPAQPDLRR